VDPDAVAVLRFLHRLDAEVVVTMGEKPVVPEPVQVFSCDVVEAVEEIPGSRVAAVPAGDIPLETFFKRKPSANPCWPWLVCCLSLHQNLNSHGTEFEPSGSHVTATG
jgi:hypothetical protein